MRAFQGVFKKKSGEERIMFFAKIKDLPSNFLTNKVAGTGNELQCPKGMELVWDLEEDDFRIFNWKTQIESIKEYEVSDQYFI